MTLLADFVTNVPVPFRQERFKDLNAGITEGVYGTPVAVNDFAVTQRAAGANMTVDVATGNAWVLIDTGTRNGIVHVNNDAVANVAIGANSSGNPRLDQVVLQYNDTSIPAGVGGNIPTLRVIAGTPTSGATLTNRLGAASLPNDALRIADVIVANGAGSITNAAISDRRPFTLGQRAILLGTTAQAYTSAGYVALNEMSYTAEFSGSRMVEIDFVGSFTLNTAGHSAVFGIHKDGVLFGNPIQVSPAGIGFAMEAVLHYIDTPAPGKHTYDIRAYCYTSSSVQISHGGSLRAMSVIESPN